MPEERGVTAQRIAWDVTGDKEIMMQIPQRIAKDIVPKMTSVQDIVKPKINTVGSSEIEYHHQVIIIEFKDDEKECQMILEWGKTSSPLMYDSLKDAIEKYIKM